MKKNSFTIYTEAIAQVSALSDADAGALFKAILRYSLDGTEPQGDNLVRFAFLTFKAQIDHENERKAEISGKRREAVQSRWDKVQMNTNEYNCMQLNTNVSPCKPPVKKPKVDPEAIRKRQEEKKADFYQSLVPFVSTYGKEMVRAFFDYWTEPNKSGTKWRFELEKTWDLSRRLNTWASRDGFSKTTSSNGTGKDIRTNSTEARKQREEDATGIVAKLLAKNREPSDS